MATVTLTLPQEPTTLYYYLEVKDGGIDHGYPGTALDKRRKHVPHQMSVLDLRPVKDEFTLDKNGFQLVDHVSKEKDFMSEEQVQKVYYPECQEIIKRLTGATRVKVISHLCRRHRYDEAQEEASKKKDMEVVTKNNPARFAHVDQSYRGAEQLLYLNLPEEEADRLTKTRWGVMNIWQPIETVERDPLAFCDFRTLDEKDFRPVTAILPPSGSSQYSKITKNFTSKSPTVSANGESRPSYEGSALAHNPDQKWYYASKQTPEEAWLFKIFDSKTDRARCAAHTSFALRGQGDFGKARQSVEARCLVFWEDQEV